MLDLPFDPPIEQLSDSLFLDKGIEVFIKREDLIHPFVSGNKWRKLKYVFRFAKENNIKQLVSFGGAYSNHLLALACAGAMYGFKTFAFVRGEEVSNHMLFMCKLWGMELHFVSREAYRNKHQLYDAKFSDDAQTMFIDEGGRGELAMKGCEEILEHIDKDFTHAICAVGTGTTLAGIAKRAAELNMHAEGICVLKGAEDIDKDVERLIPNYTNWKVHHQFHRGGYAKTDKDLMAFIKTIASGTGILLDQIYTAKMMMAVHELVKQDYFKPRSKLLLIHTGGLSGLLSGGF
jgi:1-aminocyclopropane-1-carboxylate deaminase